MELCTNPEYFVRIAQGMHLCWRLRCHISKTFTLFGSHTHPYTDGIEIWRGGVDLYSRHVHAEFYPNMVQSVAPAGRKTQISTAE